MKQFSVIVAVDSKYGIGKAGDLPWRLSADMKHFKSVTTSEYFVGRSNVVIMGRKTWESLPERFRPLPGRVNAVITSNPQCLLPEGVFRFPSFEEAVDFFCKRNADDYGRIFVIGGAFVFGQAAAHALCEELFLTRIQADFNCDVFFPHLDSFWLKVDEGGVDQENGINYQFLRYERKSA